MPDLNPEHNFEYLSDFHPARGFFKGADVTLTEEALLLPRHLLEKGKEKNDVQVVVTPKNVPIHQRLFVDVLSKMRISMKSKLAQLGVDAEDNVAEDLAKLIQSPHLNPAGELQHSYNLTVALTNWAQRPYFLEAGSPLFRFYYWDPATNTIRGRQLKEFVEEGRIHVEGKQGREWEYQYSPEDRVEDTNIVGLYVLANEPKKWIPSHPQNVPINVPSSLTDYRTYINGLLVDAPKTREEILLICRTPHMYIDKSIEGIISRNVLVGLPNPYRFSRRRKRHLNSLLIDGGSDWEIVLEILGSTEGEELVKPEPRQLYSREPENLYAELHFAWAA